MSTVTSEPPAAETEAPSSRSVWVNQLQTDQQCALVLEVRDVMVRTKADQQQFFKFRLGDASGEIQAVLWQFSERIAAFAKPGAAVYVKGMLKVDRYGPSIRLQEFRPAEPSEFVIGDLRLTALVPFPELCAMRDGLIRFVEHPGLRSLLQRLLCDGEFAQRWCVAPAARVNHEAYRHGLIEHSVVVARDVARQCLSVERIDRDLAVAGALLHDLGKADAYAFEGSTIVMTDRGKLHGEIFLGSARVKDAIAVLNQETNDPAETISEVIEDALVHIILSHHGALEYGSPVVPCTREAALVHGMDKLHAVLGRFNVLEGVLRSGSSWSGYDDTLGTSAWFTPRDPA
jgi:3'-5' exoribonuclease